MILPLVTEQEIYENYIMLSMKIITTDIYYQQKSKEEQLLKDKVNCNQDTINQYRKLLNNINVRELHKLLRLDYFNIHVMEVVTCIIATIMTLSENVYIEDASVRHWMNNLQVISTSSTESNIISSGFFNINENELTDLFIIKSPKINNSNFHETFIGVMGTNQLRSIIPNFAYLFGGFNCSPPFIINNKVISWCDPSMKVVNNLIYEQIIGTLLLDKLYDISLIDFLSYYLQIILSLKIAGDEIRFTHNDLHTGNIILRRSKYSQFYIPYPLGSDIIYIKTDRVATIIDYGMSHIEINNQHYGPTEYKFFNYDTFFPINDAYHLLIASLITMKQEDNRIYQQLEPLVNFFVEPNNLNQFLNKSDFSISYLPLNEQTNIDLQKLVSYIRDKYPITNQILTIQPDPNIPVMSCQSGCLSTIEIQQKINLLNNPVVDDLVIIFDSIINGEEPTIINKNHVKEMLYLEHIKIIDIFNHMDIVYEINIGNNYFRNLDNLLIQMISPANIFQMRMSSMEKLYRSLKGLISIYQQLNDLIISWAMIQKISPYVGLNIEIDLQEPKIFYIQYDKYQKFFNTSLENLHMWYEKYRRTLIGNHEYTILVESIITYIDMFPSYQQLNDDIFIFFKRRNIYEILSSNIPENKWSNIF